MHQIKILEIVSGLGMGGAERALINRLEFAGPLFSEMILDLRPSISELVLPTGTAKFQIQMGFKLFSPELLRIIRKENPNIIIVRTPIDFIRIGFLSSCQLIDSKLVFEVHSSFVSKNRFLGLLFSIVIRMFKGQADLVLPVSLSVKYGKLGRIFRHSEVMYLGSRVPKMNNFSLDNQGVRYLIAGRLVSIKRPMWILHRVKDCREIVAESGAKFTFIGGGDQLPKMRKFVAKNNLGAIAEVLGPVLNVSDFMNESDYLLSASISEGLPLVFYEAKLSGLRIISTPSGGGSEIFDENDILLENFSKEIFEEAILMTCHRKTSAHIKSTISKRSEWMGVEKCSAKYYRRLVRLIDNA